MKTQPSKQFDVACRKIMGLLLDICKSALEKRRSTASDSFEYRLFHFSSSEELELICRRDLPSDNMCGIRQGWLILARELGAIIMKWITDAVQNKSR